MHLQGRLQLCPALMLELPEVAGAEPLASQMYEISDNLAYSGIGLLGILHKDGKDSME